MIKIAGLLTVFGLLLAGLMAYVRLAPTQAAIWHQRPAAVVPDGAGWRNRTLSPPGPTDAVQPMPGGAYAAAFFDPAAPADVLARLDAIALATPRTRRFAGSPEAGLITWETRSAVWGFPDYTTAEVLERNATPTPFGPSQGSMLYLVARQRFGSDDYGVNAARLRDWLGKL